MSLNVTQDVPQDVPQDVTLLPLHLETSLNELVNGC